jgi:hypothetical protein
LSGFRARESPDDDEKEILSSTSPNVREVWDGKQVIRQLGDSKTTEYVYRPGRFCSKVISEVHGSSNEIFCPYQFRSFKSIAYGYTDDDDAESSISGASSVHQALDSFTGSMLAKKAPNLTLNIEKTIPEEWEVLALMSFGVLVQLGVISINALMVYYWRWLRAGHIVAHHGYPLWLVGTLGMTLGISLCSEVIRKSTLRYTLRPFKRSKTFGSSSDLSQEPLHRSPTRIFKIQEEIPALNLPEYLILQDKSNHVIHVSKRLWPLAPGDDFEEQLQTVPWNPSLLVYVGPVVTLAGFICQNIGARELHWSASVLQLMATLILLVIRALLRRRIGRSPVTEPISLSEGLKATTIAACLEDATLTVMFDWTHSKTSKYLTATKIYYRGEKDPMATYKSHFWPGDMRPAILGDPSFNKVRNMIETRQVLIGRYPPDKSNDLRARDIASALYKATHSALELVLSSENQDSFSWLHYGIQSTHLPDHNHSTQVLIPFEFTMLDKDLDENILQSMIETLISFSLDFCNRNKFPLNATYHHVYRVLNICTEDQREKTLQQIDKFSAEYCSPFSIFLPTRDALGELWEAGFPFKVMPAGPVIGLRYSSLFSGE